MKMKSIFWVAAAGLAAWLIFGKKKNASSGTRAEGALNYPDWTKVTSVSVYYDSIGGNVRTLRATFEDGEIWKSDIDESHPAPKELLDLINGGTVEVRTYSLNDEGQWEEF